MKKIAPEKWIPTDGLTLEPNALEAVKSDNNALVFAGPGAGKTELLAQRASYLLQTNSCPYPAKILAISFKKDAAFNLKERVNLRCGLELSRRFDSMTFDAFSVNLLMRFKNGLPNGYQITGQPEVVLSDSPMLDELKFQSIKLYNSYPEDRLLRFAYEQLPHLADNPAQQIRAKAWASVLAKPSPKLPLKMIMRLTNLLIDKNSLVKSYLQQTYRYIFLDEFQDTTSIQYDLLTACFFGGPCIMTAVGDDKQRIMVWAGARLDAFEAFVKDTKAQKLPLLMNFRSAPRLVALQNFFVTQLLKVTDIAQPSPHWQASDGECYLWEYNDQKTEADHLLEVVKVWLKKDGLQPRDICILVKQKPEVGARDIITLFNANGVKVRNENDYQNLITEELILFIIAILYASSGSRYTQERLVVSEYMQIFSALSNEQDLLKLEARIAMLQAELAKQLKSSMTLEEIGQVINVILAFAGEKRIKGVFTQYKDEAFFQYTLKSFCLLLQRELTQSGELISALDSCLGKDSIPVMTVHKSKGLEYHTIIFVGLEDSAFWNYSKQPAEDKCNFFVALSRAKRRIAFTFSHQRADKNGKQRLQYTDTIQQLWDSLIDSGIAVHEVIDDDGAPEE